MIIMPKQIYDRLIEYAASGAPEEVCGLIGGTESDGVREAREIYFLENALHSETDFLMVPEEQFAAIRDMRAKSISPIACFHSHPKTEATPSAKDLRLAYDEEISYIIISLTPAPAIKAFRITAKTPSDEDITVL